MATTLKETTALRGLRCRSCAALQRPTSAMCAASALARSNPSTTWVASTRRPLRADIEGGPASLWRYAPLLPVSAPSTHWPVGWTPLIEAHRLGAELGIERLYLKDDTRNPTLSFKDRPVAVALARALELGSDTIACASTAISRVRSPRPLRATAFARSCSSLRTSSPERSRARRVRRDRRARARVL